MVESFVQNLSLNIYCSVRFIKTNFVTYIFDEIHKMQQMGCILRAFEDVFNFTVWVFF